MATGTKTHVGLSLSQVASEPVGALDLKEDKEGGHKASQLWRQMAIYEPLVKSLGSGYPTLRFYIAHLGWNANQGAADLLLVQIRAYPEAGLPRLPPGSSLVESGGSE